MNKIFYPSLSSENDNYNHLNLVSLVVDDFVDVASHLLADGLIKSSDISRSEIMYRDLIIFNQVETILITSKEHVLSDFNGRVIHVGAKTVFKMQFETVTDTNFVNKDDWLKNVVKIDLSES